MSGSQIFGLFQVETLDFVDVCALRALHPPAVTRTLRIDLCGVFAIFGRVEVGQMRHTQDLHRSNEAVE